MGSEATMSAMAQLQHVWTFEDLQALPDDVDWRCWEIFDGAIVVSPSVGMRHEFVSDELRSILRSAGMPEHRLVGPIAVDLDPSYLIPDLIVVPAAVARTNVNPVDPSDVELIVEIVSPGSKTKDRIVKPAAYASAGIPVYLRVETQPNVTLTAYALAAGAAAYTEFGTWGPGEVAHLDAPFPVGIPIDAITP